MNWDRWKGRAAQGVEKVFTVGWSVGEMAYALRDPQALWKDPYRKAVLDDIEHHGLYKEFGGEAQKLGLRAGGWITAHNPYIRVGRPARDKIVAQMVNPGKERAKRALIVCHCYALPLPPLMERLFGLQEMREFDVVYNIMNHHYFGSFGAWPGFGMISVQMSQMIENLRSAVVGLRTLAKSLVHTWGYESVALLGYSIGGQLCLHVANSMEVDRLVLYCPVTDFQTTVTELGLMSWLHGPVGKGLKTIRKDFDWDDLQVMNPLRHNLAISPEQMMVVVQEFDEIVRPAQIRSLQDRYPDARFLECPGTHTYPARIREFHRALREHLV